MNKIKTATLQGKWTGDAESNNRWYVEQALALKGQGIDLVVLPEMFQDIINQAARDAKKRIRLVEFRTQGYDHPILPQSVETKYLKTMILQVME